MADLLKVESFHVDGGSRKNSVAEPPRLLEVDRNRRRTSRASPTTEGGGLLGVAGGPAVPSTKRLSANPIPATTRRRSSNVVPPHVNPAFVPRRQKVLFENTYRMEPMMKFRSDHALNVLREVFERRLRGATKYDVKQCQELARTMAGEIKHKVKDLKVDRYKYVVVVTVGQRQDSELILASRCLLDTKWDTYATYNFENYHVFATGIVFAFYFE